MTEQEAKQIKKGDKVDYRGHILTVSSIKTRGIAAPYFRLSGMDEVEPKSGSEVSYRLCSIPKQG